MPEKKIALLFDRTYIDTQACFMELAIQLANNGYLVDLYMLTSPYSQQPFFENQNIRVLPFPVSKFQKTEYWYKIRFAGDRKYNAIIGTPLLGLWLAYKTAKVQKIPYYYFADELIEWMLEDKNENERNKILNLICKLNKAATATIALGEERYVEQKRINRINYPHDHIVLPNGPSGRSVKLKSNFYRDIFNIEDKKLILLFAGTLNWNLARKVYEETKDYSNKDYHIIFQSRTLGLMGEDNHPFIKVSTMPIPGIMMNYAVSSADIGLALYDTSVHETRNGITGGKIGTYLKNELPLIAGNATNLKVFEEANVGVFWDGETPFDLVAKKAVRNIDIMRQNIPEYFDSQLRYELFFPKLLKHLEKAIK